MTIEREDSYFFGLVRRTRRLEKGEAVSLNSFRGSQTVSGAVLRVLSPDAVEIHFIHASPYGGEAITKLLRGDLINDENIRVNGMRNLLTLKRTEIQWKP